MATGGSFSGSQIGYASDMIYDFTCMPCIDDGKNTEALFQCVECQTYYCQRCVDSHNKFVKNHTVLGEAAMKSGRRQTQNPVSTSTKLPTNTCDEHDGEIIKMYCGSHDEVCCSICIAMNHRSCIGVEYIPKFARSLLQNQDRAISKTNLENLKTDLQQLKSDKLKHLQDTKEREDNIIKDLQNTKKLLQKRLEEIDRTSVTVVKTKCEQIIYDANVDVDHIDRMLKDVELHLRKSSTDDNDYDSQRFVNVKLMQKQTMKGEADLNKIRRKPLEEVGYKLDTNVSSYLEGVTSLGTLTVSEQRLTPYVNILAVVDGKAVSSIASSLQAELEKNGVYSNFIKLSQFNAKLYTVVVCDMGTADETLSNIKDELHHKTILVALTMRPTIMSKYREFLIGEPQLTKGELQSKGKNLAGIQFIYYERFDSIYRVNFSLVVNLVLTVIDK